MTDPKHASLAAALAAAQAEFPPIPKTETAIVRHKQGGGSHTYNYASLDGVLTAVRPVLSRHGIALTQRSVIGERLELVTEIHLGDETLCSYVPLPSPSADIQGFGAAMTYLRRYALVALIGVAAEEDNDAQHVQAAGKGQRGETGPTHHGRENRHSARAPEPVLLGHDRAETLRRLAEEHGIGPTEFRALLGAHGVESADELTEAQGRELWHEIQSSEGTSDE